jgi:hypothetical protein
MVIAETAKLEKVVARAKRLQGRFKRKKASSDDNLMELMLGWHLDTAGHGASQVKREIAARERAIAALKDYSFDPEASGPMSGGLTSALGGRYG